MNAASDYALREAKREQRERGEAYRDGLLHGACLMFVAALVLVVPLVLLIRG